MELWSRKGSVFYYYYFIPPEHVRLQECGENFAEGLSFAIFAGDSIEYRKINYLLKINFRGLRDTDLVSTNFHKVQYLAQSGLDETTMQNLIERVKGWGDESME